MRRYPDRFPRPEASPASIRGKLLSFLSVIVFLLLVCPHTGSAADIRPIRVVLENGLTVLILEKPALPIVSVEALVKAGSVYDSDDRSGLANLTASLLNEGTKKWTSTQLAEAVDFIGASLSIAAEDDYVTVDLKTLKKDTVVGFDILSDILIRPLFELKEVERVKNQILGNIQSEKDQPQVIAQRAFLPAVFGSHPYRNPTIGREETVARLGREDVSAFHHDYYRPNNTILVIVGDVTFDEAMALVKKYFSSWENKEPPFPKIAPPVPVEATKVKLIDKDLTQASVMLGHVGINRKNPDYYAVIVMNYILGGGGFSSRMMSDIRDNKGLVYSIYSRFSANRLSGTFVVSFQTKAISTNEAIEGVLGEIRKMRERGVSSTELREAKDYLTGSFPLRMDTTAKLASLIALVEFYQLGSDYFERYAGQINRVTREDVLRVAKQYLDPDRYVLVVVAKQSEAKVKE